MKILAQFVFLLALLAAPFSSPAAVVPQEADQSATSEQSDKDLDAAARVQALKETAEQSDSEDAEKERESFLFNGENPQSIEDLKFMEQRFDELAKKLFPATVNIQVGASQGSGVVVTSDGYILTAAHVIAKPGEVATVFFPDGKKRYFADTLGVNSGAIDSGMLKIRNRKGEVFPSIDLGVSEDLKLGQWVMAVGHPGGIDTKRGLVTRVGRIVGATDGVIRTDCTLVGGDSGGPLIDMKGNLIGIHSRIGGTLIDNLHVPVDQYSDNWDKLAQGLLLHALPSLGVDIVGETNEIEKVAEGKAAEEGGMKVGDKVIKFGDREITNKAELGAAITKCFPRQKVKVAVLRGEEEVELELTIGQR